MMPAPDYDVNLQCETVYATLLPATFSEHEVMTKVVQEAARLVNDMADAPGALKNCHELSLRKLQRVLGKCADLSADTLDGFERLHDDVRAYRKAQASYFTDFDKNESKVW